MSDFSSDCHHQPAPDDCHRRCGLPSMLGPSLERPPPFTSGVTPDGTLWAALGPPIVTLLAQSDLCQTTRDVRPAGCCRMAGTGVSDPEPDSSPAAPSRLVPLSASTAGPSVTYRPTGHEALRGTGR